MRLLMRIPGNAALLIIDVQRAIDDQGASTSLIYSLYKKTWMAGMSPAMTGAGSMQQIHLADRQISY